MTRQTKPAVSGSGENSLLGLLIRMYWMAFGNLPLLFLPILIIKSRTPEFTRRDVMFIVAWAALAIARLADARFFNPVPAADVRKYILGLTGVSAGLIAFGHIVAKLMS
ncbi:MAG TPA: hypothetical protein PKH54_05105 [Myxococcota bacterium]|nr:hypothetical protein [Myxococcota bacterium]HOA14562.1 hypothetical protein [Myxococcota bacterium]HOC99302.1 hypothetical protein [Myxococcota bacterium]HOH77913.1 hypothetical protein [Myxococcota bacterium]HPV05139.1 hypothetical protein [Myxococcota bacterium]